MRDLRAFTLDPVARVCLLFIVVAAPLPFINIGTLPFWADDSIAVLPAHKSHKDLLPTSPYDLDQGDRLLAFRPVRRERGGRPRLRGASQVLSSPSPAT